MREYPIIFQLATQQLSKLSIRLECFFYTIEQACNDSHPVVHHYALKNVLEIIDLAEKPELKSHFLKELMRIEHLFNQTNSVVSNLPCGKLGDLIQKLIGIPGKFGGDLHQNNFLQSLRISHQAGKSETEFNSPQFLFWLEGSSVRRQQDLLNWLQELQHLRDTVSTYLSIFRNMASFEHINMLNGFYHRTLSSKKLCHLVLIKVDRKYEVIPKLHIGHHGLTLRLNDAFSLDEVKPNELRIELSICQL